jgi:hypothetical protein
MEIGANLVGKDKSKIRQEYIRFSNDYRGGAKCYVFLISKKTPNNYMG